MDEFANMMHETGIVPLKLVKNAADVEKDLLERAVGMAGTAAGDYHKQAFFRMLDLIYNTDSVQTRRSNFQTIRMTLFHNWTDFFQHLLNKYCDDSRGSCVFPKSNGVFFLDEEDCASPAWANVPSTQTDLLGMAHLTMYVFFAPATITFWPTSHFRNRQHYAARRLNFEVGTLTSIKPWQMEIKMLDAVCIQSDLLHHISPWTCSNNTLNRECAYAKWTWTSRWTGGNGHDRLIDKFVRPIDAGGIDQLKHMEETFLRYKNSAMLSFSDQSEAQRISVLDPTFINIAKGLKSGTLKYTVGGQKGRDFDEDFKHLFSKEVTDSLASSSPAPGPCPAPAPVPVPVFAPAPAPAPAPVSVPVPVPAPAPAPDLALAVTTSHAQLPASEETHALEVTDDQNSLANETHVQNNTEDTFIQATNSDSL